MSLIDDALSLNHAVKELTFAESLVAFKTLLKDKFQIEADPQALTITHDGVQIRFINPRELAVERKCPKCQFVMWTDGMMDLEQLAHELATRDFHSHNCKY